jgi:hypothetical protein
VPFSVLILERNLARTFVWYLPCCVVIDFLGTVLTGLLEHELSRKVDWETTADRMASSVSDLPMMDCFMKEHFYALNPRTVEDLVAALHATVTTVSANMLKRVSEHALLLTAFCLEMD